MQRRAQTVHISPRFHDRSARLYHARMFNRPAFMKPSRRRAFAASRALSLLLAAAAAIPLSGCAGHEREEEENNIAIGLNPDPRGVNVFRADGTLASWQEMVDASAGAEAVLIGENHGHALGLASAAALWEDVLKAAKASSSGAKPALAMEFFERDEQDALDDYLAGITDEAAFKKSSARTDGNYPAGHRDMVERAREAGVPVIAANAPRRYVRLARLDGFDRLSKLTTEQRRLFRIPDEIPTGPYRDRFNEVMTPAPTQIDAGGDSHGGQPAADHARLDPIFRSQSVWDWTMAESVNNALGEGFRPVVLVVGRFHVDLAGGTTLAMQKLRPGVRTLTVSFVDAHAWSMPDEDKGRGDFVVYVGGGAE
jgi:uncharacterized iron-regulated protein